MDDLKLGAWLFAHGAGESACSVMVRERGSVAEMARRNVKDCRLRHIVHAVFVRFPRHAPKGMGIVAAMTPRYGAWDLPCESARIGHQRSMHLVRQNYEVPRLESVKFALPDGFEFDGDSFALADYLSTVAFYSPNRPLARAVIAIGALDVNGDVLPVGYMDLKLAAALRERGPKLIFVPAASKITGPIQFREGDATEIIPVGNVREATEHLFGPGFRLEVRPRTFSSVIEMALTPSDWERSLEGLDAVVQDTLTVVERITLLQARGTVLTHLGRSSEGCAMHAEAEALRESLPPEDVSLPEAVQGRLVRLVSQLDEHFRMDEVIADLSRPDVVYTGPLSRLRYRGTLAQAYAMRGDLRKAIELRVENLALHEKSEKLGETRSGTLCLLTIDSARAGDREGFETFAAQLATVRAANEAHQARYNAQAFIRGWVALRDYARALAWARGDSVEYGIGAPKALRGLVRRYDPGPLQVKISSHPEVSTLRAFCRALRKCGHPDEAWRLASRAVRREQEGDGSDLVAFLCEVLRLEGTLALPEFGRTQQQAEIRAMMQKHHPAACRFHADLFTTDGDGLEHAIDQIWY